MHYIGLDVANKGSFIKVWHERVAKRRGFKTALVGLARKILQIVFYVLRDRREYDYRLLSQGVA